MRKRDLDFDSKMHDVLVIYKRVSLQYDENGNLKPFKDVAVHTFSYGENRAEKSGQHVSVARYHLSCTGSYCDEINKTPVVYFFIIDPANFNDLMVQDYYKEQGLAFYHAHYRPNSSEDDLCCQVVG